MHRFILTCASAAAILAAGSLVTTNANAAPLGGASGINGATTGLDMTETVAWCFYPLGWNGPGWYRCGQHQRRGYGWHGPRDSSHHNRRESRRGHW